MAAAGRPVIAPDGIRLPQGGLEAMGARCGKGGPVGKGRQKTQAGPPPSWDNGPGYVPRGPSLGVARYPAITPLSILFTTSSYGVRAPST